MAALSAAGARWRGGRPASRTDPGSAPGPIRLRLAGGGRFGRGRFTVLWVGLDGDIEALRELGAILRTELRRARLPYDRKPLRPHLTLARPGERLDVADDLLTLGRYAGPEWTVDTLTLVRSHLGPKPTYDRLAEVPLDPK
jgi:2'-5' RNA ligase